MPLVISWLLVEPAIAAEYYFSGSGNDQTGDGTQLSPWRTIAKFNILDLNPGDQTFFRAGDTFAGSLMLDANDTGTNATGDLIAPIGISSYGGGVQDRAIIRSPPTAGALIAHNMGGIELKNLEFFNGGTFASNSESGIQFQLDQTATTGFTYFRHVRIDNVISRGFHRSGVSLQAASSVGYQDVEVTNSQFFDNEFAGIEVGAADWTELIHRDIRIDGVIARNNPGFAGCSPHCGHGIVLGQIDDAVVENSAAYSNGVMAGKGNVGIWTWQSNNVLIERNTAYGNRSPDGGDGGGFDIDGGVTNSLVQYNISYDNAGAGYLLAQFGFAEPMQQNVFRYNLSANDGIDGYGAFTVWGEDNSSIASSTLFHNNTVVVDHNVTPGNRGVVWFINGNHEDIELINNVFVALNGASLIDGTTSVDQAQFVNNAFWTSGAPILIGGQLFSSIADWAATSQQETVDGNFVGVEANPNFGSGTDYRPILPSPLIDAGLPFGSMAWPDWFAGLGPIDLYGTPVPQGQGADIGASEFSPLAGDYNSNGVVDAADYLLWRDTLGIMGAGLVADGNGNGSVDPGDYEVWKAHFGQSANATGAFVTGINFENVPEPASTMLVTLGMLALIARRLPVWHI